MPQLEISQLALSPQHLKTLQALLAQHTPKAAVWAYGSRVNGQAHETSDLDLVLRNPSDSKQSVQGFFELKEALQESSLPILVDIHDWAHLPEAFHRNIEAGYVVVQEGRQRLGMGNEWRDAKFSELCSISRGASPRPIHDWIVGEGIPWVKIADATSAGSRYINRTNEFIRTEGKAKSVAVFPGDLILTNSATPGIPMFMGIEACVHDGWMLLRNFKGLDKLFAYYLLLHERPALVQQGNGSVFTNLKTDILKNHKVKIPDIPEQHAIAHILGTLDDKIELNRKQNETLEAMARALFKAWFVDFEPVRAKMEGRWQRGQSLPGLPAHLYDLFPDRLVESELGEIPEGWEYKQLSQFIEILDSQRVPLSSKERAKRQGIYPYHGATGVMDNVDDYLFDGIHVLLGEDGSVVRENGHPFTQYVWGRFWVNNHAHVMRGRGLSSETLLLFLNQCDVAPFVTGAVQLKLSQGNLKSIPFLNPGEILLGKLGELIAPIFAKIRDISDESRTLAALRDTLLPKLISGALRIQNAEVFLKEKNF